MSAGLGGLIGLGGAEFRFRYCLWRHQASRAFRDIRELERIVLPMAVGTVLGSTVGGWLVVHVPASAVELLLGCVLIGSALRVFKVRAHVGPERVQPT